MLIYGKNSVLGALSAEHPVEKIVFEAGSDKDERIRMIKDVASRQKVPMEYKVGSWFQKSLGDVPHQGIAAQCARVRLLDMNALMGVMPAEPARAQSFSSTRLPTPTSGCDFVGRGVRAEASSCEGPYSHVPPAAVSASAGRYSVFPRAVGANLANARSVSKDVTG